MDRFCFETIWYDNHAELDRRYEFFFYPIDRTIEMYDPKQKKTFLKRSQSDLKLEDLFIGAAINVHARQLLIKDFADEYTRKTLTQQMESSILILKNGGMSNLGNVLDILRQGSFIIAHMRQIKFDEQLAKMFENQSSFTQGTCVVFELVREDAIQALQECLSGLDIPYYCCDNSAKVNELISRIFQPTRPIPRTVDFNNCTLCIVRPHAIVSGKIIDDIIKGGYRITDLELVILDSNQAEIFLEVYKGVVPEYHSMLMQLTTGPLLAMALTLDGQSTVEMFRKFCGTSDPSLSRHIFPDSLRAKYGQDKVRNAVHCSDLNQDGLLECEYFFGMI